MRASRVLLQSVRKEAFGMHTHRTFERESPSVYVYRNNMVLVIDIQHIAHKAVVHRIEFYDVYILHMRAEL